MRERFIYFCAGIALIGSLEAFSLKNVARWCGIGTAGIGTVVALRLHKKAVALEKKLVEKSLVQQARRSRNRALTGALLGAGVAVGSLFMRDDEAQVSVALSEPGERIALVPIPVSNEVVSKWKEVSIANESGNSAISNDLLKMPNVVMNNVLEVLSSTHQAGLADVFKAAEANASAQGYVAFSSAPRAFDKEKARKMLALWDRHHHLKGDLIECCETGQPISCSDFFNTLFDIVVVPADNYCGYHVQLFNSWWSLMSSQIGPNKRPVAFAAGSDLIHRVREETASQEERFARAYKSGNDLDLALNEIAIKYRSKARDSSVWIDLDEYMNMVWCDRPLSRDLFVLMEPDNVPRDITKIPHSIFVNNNHWNAVIPKPEVVALLERDQRSQSGVCW